MVIGSEGAHRRLEQIIGELETLGKQLNFPEQLRARFFSALRELSEVVVVLGSHTLPAAELTGQPQFSPRVVQAIDKIAAYELEFGGSFSAGLAIYFKACKNVFPRVAVEFAHKDKLLDAVAIIASVEKLLDACWTAKQDTFGKNDGELYLSNITRGISYRMGYKFLRLTYDQFVQLTLKAASEITGKDPESVYNSVATRLKKTHEYVASEWSQGAVTPFVLPAPLRRLEEYVSRNPSGLVSPSEKMGFSLLANALCEYYLAVCKRK